MVNLAEEDQYFTYLKDPFRPLYLRGMVIETTPTHILSRIGTHSLAMKTRFVGVCEYPLSLSDLPDTALKKCIDCLPFGFINEA